MAIAWNVAVLRRYIHGIPGPGQPPLTAAGPGMTPRWPPVSPCPTWQPDSSWVVHFCYQEFRHGGHDRRRG